jgi:hypothetical protein
MTIKVSYRSIHSVLAFGLAAGAFTFAVERPAHLDDERPRLSNEEAPIGGKKKKDVAVIEVRPEEDIVAAGEKIPYFGIGSVPVSEVLAGHLDLDHGVVVQRVHKGSGADEAGLQKDDILVNFAGRKIAGPLDLRDAVQACEIGDTVAVTLVRKGETEEREVILSARPEGLPRFAPGNQRGMGQLQQVWPRNGGNGNGGMPDDALERLEQLRGIIDEQFNDVGLGLKMNDILDGKIPENGEPMNVELGAQSSVTWADAEGDITMKMSNGDTKVTVRDRKGNVIYQGPWNDEEDKASVEPAVRERIENMGVSRRGNQLKFWMDQPGGK